jgi:thioredoxin reductase (NADPH)
MDRMSPVRQDVTVVGRRLEPEDYRLRDFLTRIAQPYEWLEAGTPEADALLAEHGFGADDLPLLLAGDGPVARATVERVADAWHESAPPQQSHYDLAIVGAGPAGLAAAVYAASDGLSTLLVERDVPGGQASYTSRIENFFGFPDGIGGAELARSAGRQAEGFGAELVLLRGVTESRLTPDGTQLDVAGGYQVTADVVIASPGMDWRRLDAPGVEAGLGRGVYYGAGRSEAAQCGGDPVVVVGAGNSAGQAVMNLGDAGARVTMLVRGSSLAKSMSAYLVERIHAHPLIDVRLRTQLEEVHLEGHDDLAAVTAGGERLNARALFLCLGGVPRTGWADAAGVRLDERGFILTGPDLRVGGALPEDWPLDRDPLALETSVPGVFAAGDVRSGSVKRVAGAVGDGAMAVALAHRRLEELARSRA